MTTAESKTAKAQNHHTAGSSGRELTQLLFPRPVPPVRLSPSKLREPPPALSTIKPGRPWHATPAAPPSPTQAQDARSGTITECTHRPAPRRRPLSRQHSGRVVGHWVQLNLPKVLAAWKWRASACGGGTRLWIVFPLLRDISPALAERCSLRHSSPCVEGVCVAWLCELNLFWGEPLGGERECVDRGRLAGGWSGGCLSVGRVNSGPVGWDGSASVVWLCGVCVTGSLAGSDSSEAEKHGADPQPQAPIERAGPPGPLPARREPTNPRIRNRQQSPFSASKFHFQAQPQEASVNE